MATVEERLRRFLGEAQRESGEARQALFEFLGDDEAFLRAMHALAQRLLSRRHPARSLYDSQDLVQSTIRTGLEHFGGFRGSSESELYGWFRSILRSKLARASRSRHSQLLVDAESVADPNSDSSDAPESPGLSEPLRRLIREEIQESLRREIEALPVGQRLVLELRIRGADTEQIGNLLDLKPATVRKRESRAVEKLRERFPE